jgi:APA family basic amino acid/polyamine antiporter
MADRTSVTALLQPRLSLWDTVSIIVGIIVGVGIFQAPTDVFENVSGPWAVVGVWALGGLLSLIGALCFAELASTYPRTGGEYLYLTRAYGPFAGFFFAWAQLAVIRTGGSIAAVAYIFGDNAALLWRLSPQTSSLFAAGVILLLSCINILGTNPGKKTQNTLTIAKVLGLAGIVLAGFVCAGPHPETAAVAVHTDGSFALAMIFVLYAYAGWNEAVYVSREVQDGRRNVPLALIVGTLSVTVIYLLVNAAYLFGLGFADARATGKSLPAATVALALGDWGAQAILILVMVSALGSINGTIFTAARLYAAFGAGHRLFAPLGRWHPRLGTPAFALLVQAALGVGMVAGVGFYWEGKTGFDSLVKATAPVIWFFFLLTGISVFVLRWKEPDIERPFRVPLYPVLPLIFCGWCGYMLYGSIVYAREQALAGLALLVLGVPFYLVSRLLEKPRPAVAPPTDAPALAQQRDS